ncbi:phosphoribosylglycinamide formyltransferase [uncultured Pseudoteredinibacter sp.]|uniref:phosphoribosylglycinamide formyltransferase n=1 Tax=uncultured Pseudoteredinibacter sp. TaxID=1641701 RepID=UPI0026125D22|nr:phosphoribosylglycinamide formyltransferase [uncultured Pseudoteredinibacter sp.]
MNKPKARIVVLISGSGSNLQAMIDCQQANALGGEIVAVISNRPAVKGLERADAAGIEALCLDHKGFADRETFDQALQAKIDEYQPDLVVLAGFMRILTPAFTEHYLGRMINIHPSLLPKHQGLNTHQRAIDAGDAQHGATVHFVTAELDGGPAIVQVAVDIEADDSAESLAKKVQYQEHYMFPIAVQWFCEGRLRLHKENKNHVSLFNGEPLPISGRLIKAR